jgi:hypothetical protein
MISCYHCGTEIRNGLSCQHGCTNGDTREMDKHTRRYMYEQHDMWFINARDLADVIKDGEYEAGYLYDAIDCLDSEVERKVLKEELTRRRLGF